MNIQDLLARDKAVSTAALFKSGTATATAVQILKDEQLKEHMTQVPALLICLSGNVVFENEVGAKETLLPGDYFSITPLLKHWVNAISDSHLILLK